MKNFTENQKELIAKNLNNVIASTRAILKRNAEFELVLSKKDFVTKVLSKSFVFLIAPSFSDDKRLLEIVSACLLSVDKKTVCEIELDETFVSSLVDFLCNDNSLKVVVENSQISLSSNSGSIVIASDPSSDKISLSILARSLCVLLAICGQQVSINIDGTKLNDHGCVSVHDGA